MILRSIYWSYRTWTCISDLIHVLQSIYLSYRYESTRGTTELIRMLLRQEYPWVLQNLYRDRTYHIRDLSDTGQNLYEYRSYQRHDLSDTEVPVGTTGLIQDRTYQIQDLSDTRVPVGTTEHIRY